MIGRALRWAARRLGRTPGYAVAVTMTLALGIGATAAVFTAVRSVLLVPPPYPEAARLVALSGTMAREGEEPQDWPIGLLDIEALEAELGRGSDDAAPAGAPAPDPGPALIGPAAFTGARSFNLSQGETVAHVNAEMVTGNYFEVLGVMPVAGRLFDDAEDRDGAPVAVLAESLWREAFGGDPAVLGTTIRLNDRAYQVVGVMAPGFRGMTDAADLWLPIRNAGRVYNPGYITVRPFRWLAGVARLADGRTLAEAQAAVSGVMAGLEETYPDDNGGFGIALAPLEEWLFGEIRTPLLLLALTAGLVLLIACVNIANLMLARMLDRRRELAMQRALGASRGWLAAWWGSEGAILAAAGGAAGLGLATWGVALFVRSGAAELPGFAVPAVDGSVLAVAAAASLLAGGASVAVAAFLTRGAAPMTELREAGRDGLGDAWRGRSQKTLIAGQAAMAMVLLVQALLVAGSFVRLMKADLGFDPGGVLTMRLDLNEQRFADDERYVAAARDIVERASAVAGVSAVALQGPGYPGFGSFGIHLLPDGRDPRDYIMGTRNHVTPGFLRALDIPLLAGRAFDDGDVAEGARVMIVSRSFAEQAWPGQDAVGRRLRVAQNPSVEWTVVGVAGDVRFQGRSRGERLGTDIYIPLLQSPPRNPALLNVLARIDGAGIAGALRDAVAAAVPGLPVFDVDYLETTFRRQTATGRIVTAIMLAFAALAVLLTAVGVFAMTAYATRRATREIAIRRAVGGEERRILGLIIRRGAAPVLAGAGLGVVLAPLVARAFAARLPDTGTPDPLLLGAAAAGLVAIGIAAALFPARRALRDDPGEVLSRGG